MIKNKQEKQNYNSRAEAGLRGTGNFYRIEINSKKEFVKFRYQDVGERGHIERLAGQRDNGEWHTHAWLIDKKDAHIENNSLIPDADDAKELFKKQFRSTPNFVESIPGAYER